MTPIRFRTDKVMISVALVAVNVAVFRSLFMTRRVDSLAGGSLLWIVMQVAAYRAFRTCGRSKAFWAGFTVFGSLMALPRLLIGFFPDASPMVFCRWYYGFVEPLSGWMESVLDFRRFGGWPPVILFCLLHGVLYCLPSMLAALSGGLIARLIYRDPNPVPVLEDQPAAP